MAKILLIFVFGIFALVNKVNAACDVCSTVSSAACINETYYDICFGTSRLNQPRPCESGKVCTTLAGICQTPTSTVAPDCTNECNTCAGTTLKLACVSATQFVVCDTSTPAKPGSETIDCGDKKYCNLKSYQAAVTAGTVTLDSICTSSCTSEPTCPLDVILNPAEEYTKSCVGITDAGAYPNKSDPTCKTYVYCEKYGSTMYSFKYTCSTGYFSKEQSACVTTKPTYCSA